MLACSFCLQSTRVSFGSADAFGNETQTQSKAKIAQQCTSIRLMKCLLHLLCCSELSQENDGLDGCLKQSAMKTGTAMQCHMICIALQTC